jgi:predicted ester cyclase
MTETLQQPLATYQEFQRRLSAQDFDHIDEVVDVQGYTENCLGLTGWTTGFEVALQNWVKNMVQPWTDLQFTVQEVVEGQYAVTLRSRVDAIHSGEFLGIPATGRRLAWDVINIVQVKDGRVTGQWIQFDLWGIYKQLTAG